MKVLSEFSLGVVASKILRFLSDKSFVRLQYLRRFKTLPKLNNPQSFNEKLLWLKLHWRDPSLPRCVNKFEVRQYVSQRVGKKYLIPLHAYYPPDSRIEYTSLPSKFVMKAVHGSGWNFIKNTDERVSSTALDRIVDDWNSQNFYWMGREWAYKECGRGVVIEEFLDDGHGQPPKDYKFFCFDGRVHMVQVDSDRFVGHRRALYSAEWQKLDVRLEYEMDDKSVAKPSCYEEMLEVAAALSKEFPFVRVDLYEVNGSVYFGELTFYPGKGVERFEPAEMDNKLGELLTLPQL